MNAFKLHGLPTPRPGSVLGLRGRRLRVASHWCHSSLAWRARAHSPRTAHRPGIVAARRTREEPPPPVGELRCGDGARAPPESPTLAPAFDPPSGFPRPGSAPTASASRPRSTCSRASSSPTWASPRSRPTGTRSLPTTAAPSCRSTSRGCSRTTCASPSRRGSVCMATMRVRRLRTPACTPWRALAPCGLCGRPPRPEPARLAEGGRLGPRPLRGRRRGPKGEPPTRAAWSAACGPVSRPRRRAAARPSPLPLAPAPGLRPRRAL